MKNFALLLALFAVSCASNDAFLEKGVETCEPGSDIELAAGMADSETFSNGRFIALVEVANNSNRDFTVKSVRVDPATRAGQARTSYEIQGGARALDIEIPQGESETFEVPIYVTVRDRIEPMTRGVNVPFEATVSVTLADGGSARCRFVLQARF